MRYALREVSRALPAGSLGALCASTYHVAQRVRRDALPAFAGRLQRVLGRLAVKVRQAGWTLTGVCCMRVGVWPGGTGPCWLLDGQGGAG